MNANSFVSPDVLLADILDAVDDANYEWNTKGYYISQMQQCLEELSFDSFFDERSASFDFPRETLSLSMPTGIFNLKQVYVYQGESCFIGAHQIVWHKRNFITKGQGSIARNTGVNNNDPFYFPGRHHNGHVSVNRNDGTEPLNHIPFLQDNFYYNVQNGLIMFSAKCAVFPKVFLVFNGTGGDLGEIPVIPIFFRQTVKDFVCEAVLRNRMSKDNKWAALWKVYDRNLNKHDDHGFFKGSWYNAQKRVKSMDSAERESLKEYLSRPSF